MRKAAELLGLGRDAVRTIPIDGDFRMDVRALSAAVAADRRPGAGRSAWGRARAPSTRGRRSARRRWPTVCRAEGLWFHVDGAYGAVGAADRASRPATPGSSGRIRWRSTRTSGSRCRWSAAARSSRDGRLLRDTWSLVPLVPPDRGGKGFGGLPWYSEYGFQQTRGFRALKLWMIAPAPRPAWRGRGGPAVTSPWPSASPPGWTPRRTSSACAPVTLSVVCFRYVPPGWAGDAARLDALNKLLVERIQGGGAGLRHRHGARRPVRAARVRSPLRDVGGGRRRLVGIVRETGARRQSRG